MVEQDEHFDEEDDNYMHESVREETTASRVMASDGLYENISEDSKVIMKYCI